MVGWGARGFRYKLAKKNTWPPEFGAIGKKFLSITLSLGELGADGWEVMEADGPQCKAERETVAAHSLRPWLKLALHTWGGGCVVDLLGVTRR